MRTIVCKDRKCVLKEVSHMDNQTGAGQGLSPIQFTYTLPLQKVHPNTGKNKRKSYTPKKQQKGGKRRRVNRKKGKGGKKSRKPRKKRAQTGGKSLKSKNLKGKGKKKSKKRSKSRK